MLIPRGSNRLSYNSVVFRDMAIHRFKIVTIRRCITVPSENRCEFMHDVYFAEVWSMDLD